MSISLKIYNQEAAATGNIDLPEGIFGLEANQALIHQAMVAQMGNERQVLAHTKTKGEVRGGGKKPWKQKGTGRARAGSSRSPLWRGGGIVFGPLNERNFKKDLNKKMKRKALFMVLSDKVSSEAIAVVDSLEMAEFKTKKMDSLVKSFEGKVFSKGEAQKRSVLLIDNSKDEKVKYSARNLAGIKMINLDNINILDLLKYKNLVVSAGAIKSFADIYLKDKSE